MNPILPWLTLKTRLDNSMLVPATAEIFTFALADTTEALSAKAETVLVKVVLVVIFATVASNCKVLVEPTLMVPNETLLMSPE